MKRNVLVITLGKSDVTVKEGVHSAYEIVPDNGASRKKYFLYYHGENTGIGVLPNRNQEGSYQFVDNRIAAQAILKDFDNFNPILEYPLVTPLLEYLSKKKIEIHKVWWVFTDQEDPLHRGGDTIFFKDILQRHFCMVMSNAPEFGDIPIQHDLFNIDKQYESFSRIRHSPFSDAENIEHAILFAQGGIDQINQALTLQFIQTFKDRTMILQKPENAEVSELRFPVIFLRELNRYKIIRHLELFDFAAASELFPRSFQEERTICNFLAARLNLDGPQMWQYYVAKNDLITHVTQSPLPYMQKKWKDLPALERDIFHVKDVYAMVTFLEKQGRYGDALVRAFTLFENLFGVLIAKSLGLESRLPYDPDSKWGDRNENYLNSLSSIHVELIPYLKKLGINLYNPTRIADVATYRFLIERQLIISPLTIEQIDYVQRVIEVLARKRNAIAHKMAAMTNNTYHQLYEDQHEEFFGFLRALLGEDPNFPFQNAQQYLLKKLQ